MFTATGTGRIVNNAQVISQGNDGVGTIVTFSVADTEQPKDKEGVVHTSYLNVKVFGVYASRVAKHLTKGKLVLVTGTLKQERWEKDGKTASRNVIIAEHIEFLNNSFSNKKDDKGTEADAQEETPKSAKKAESAPAPAKKAPSAPKKSTAKADEAPLDKDNTVSADDIPY